MRIAACTVRAVAAEKELAGRDTVVSHLVGHVAIVAECTGVGTEDVLADGDLVGIMGEVAPWAVRTGTYTICQRRRRAPTGGPGATVAERRIRQRMAGAVKGGKLATVLGEELALWPGRVPANHRK